VEGARPHEAAARSAACRGGGGDLGDTFARRTSLLALAEQHAEAPRPRAPARPPAVSNAGVAHCRYDGNVREDGVDHSIRGARRPQDDCSPLPLAVLWPPTARVQEPFREIAVPGGDAASDTCVSSRGVLGFKGSWQHPDLGVCVGRRTWRTPVAEAAGASVLAPGRAGCAVDGCCGSDQRVDFDRQALVPRRASTGPSWVFGLAAASPDSTARPVAIASTTWDLPCRRRSCRAARRSRAAPGPGGARDGGRPGRARAARLCCARIW
jgi:hypothetical protein